MFRCCGVRVKNAAPRSLFTAAGRSGSTWRALPGFSPRTFSHLASSQQWQCALPHLPNKTWSATHPPAHLPLTPARPLSSDSTFYSVIHVAENYFQTFHSLSHLPWWAVILASTALLRSLLTLPLAVYQNRIIAKMELLLPTLREYQEAVQHNLVVKCRRENLPVEEANRRIKKAAKQVAKDLYTQEGCSPYRVAILPWVQLPLWITLSFALRNMAGVFPGLLPSEHVKAAMASEGCLWFPDLTLPDPYHVLPLLLVATNLCNIELHALRRQAPTRTRRIFTNSLRVLSVGLFYVASQMPAAMSLYWSASSTYGLVQNVLFNFPRVRRALNIPRTPSESKTPFKDLWAIVQDKTRAFVTLQREAMKKKSD